MYKKILPLAITLTAILLFTTPVLAINKTCLDNTTLQVNTTYYIDTSSGESEVGVSKNIYCPFGCSNGECEGSSVEGDMSQMWLTYATGTILLILGTIIKLPSLGNVQSKSDVIRPNNMMMVVKYIFFFIGFFLVYLSFGMARRIGSVYGGEGNVTDATDTATMVIMITMILFLILFVVEFIFNIIKWIKERSMKNEKSKFETEEEEE